MQCRGPPGEQKRHYHRDSDSTSALALINLSRPEIPAASSERPATRVLKLWDRFLRT